MDRSYYADIEAGRRNPSLAVLGKIAQALNSPLSDLFSGM